MSEQIARQPQFLAEVNTLLEMASGQPASLGSFEAESISTAPFSFEDFIYRSYVRGMAMARAEDRAEVNAEPTYLPSHFNKRWQITTKKLAALALDPQISFLARQHTLVDEVSQSFSTRWEELKEELYADQQLYARDLIDGLQKGPRFVEYTDREGQPRQKAIFGVTAIAPTGAGKTHLIEMCATVIADSSVDRFTTLVVPSLVAQHDILNKLTKDLPHLRIGGMSSEIDDPPEDNDIMVITTESFSANFRNNQLKGRSVDMLMIDEVHHLTAPEFRQTWLEQWDGYTMGFTATPAYSLDKDVRQLIPHIIEHCEIMDLIDIGRLNDGQIFTFAIDNDLFQQLPIDYGVNPTKAEDAQIIRYIIDSLVIDFVKTLVRHGRRGIIFCEPGNTALNARELARRLREDEEQPVRAEAMYSAGNNQHDIMERYRNDKLDVITTVDSGRESLDAPFGFVISNCTIRSRLRGKQITGRGTRHNEHGITVFGQFINLLFARRHKKRTVFI